MAKGLDHSNQGIGSQQGLGQQGVLSAAAQNQYYVPPAPDFYEAHLLRAHGTRWLRLSEPFPTREEAQAFIDGLGGEAANGRVIGRSYG